MRAVHERGPAAFSLCGRSPVKGYTAGLERSKNESGSAMRRPASRLDVEPNDPGARFCISVPLELEPEQPSRCEEEWGEPASQGFEPGSGVIWSPECLGCWGDRYLWHPNTLRGDGAIPGRTGAAPVHGE